MKKWITLSALLCLFAFTIQAQTAAEYVDKAVKEVNKKKFDKALDYLNQAIDLQPDSAEYYYLRGQVNYALGSSKAGAKDFETAIKKILMSIARTTLLVSFIICCACLMRAKTTIPRALSCRGCPIASALKCC
ncbi:MAG: tetratricopeptide repeat protein [Sphingobacteriales bacterium JAD_PAG50586_3]|nr:MAG: tetratricopeptide repeat protein [Sphingobacteriales bacterium JAD_PAG50586_3]